MNAIAMITINVSWCQKLKVLITAWIDYTMLLEIQFDNLPSKVVNRFFDIIGSFKSLTTRKPLTALLFLIAHAPDISNENKEFRGVYRQTLYE